MTEEIAAYDAFGIVPVQQIRMQVNAIQELMQAVMQENTHYGTIPGCGDKPTLLQPGAQKIMLMFQLADDYEIVERNLGNGHREYRVKCTLCNRNTGLVQGSGNGLCSTMESKYRYRNVADWEDTGEPIPNDARQRKAEYRKQGFGMKKVNGQWLWVRYLDAQKSENPDIADTYNTVLKMACKRALVSAVLNATAASDIFTQDIEDMPQFRFAEKPDLTELGNAMRDMQAQGVKVSDMKQAIRDALGKDYDRLSQSDVPNAVAVVLATGTRGGEADGASGQEIAPEEIGSRGDALDAAPPLFEEDQVF